jgi:hypothetical protein
MAFMPMAFMAVTRKCPAIWIPPKGGDPPKSGGGKNHNSTLGFKGPDLRRNGPTNRQSPDRYQLFPSVLNFLNQLSDWGGVWSNIEIVDQE